MSAVSNQQETGVIAIAPSPVSPVASSSYLRPAIVDAKSGPGVARPPPVLLYQNASHEDPGMGQNTIPVTPYYHGPSQVSDAKSGPGVLQQHYAQPNFFQQQTVPVPEEFQTVPIPQPYQQQTVPIPEEAYQLNRVPVPEPYKRQSVPALEDSYQLHTVPIPEPYQQQTVSTPEEYDQQTVPQYEERLPQVLEQCRRNTPLHPASSSSTLSSPTSLEKPPFIFNDDLDENGFTSEERRNHQATIKRLHVLRWVMYSRWLIRIVSVFVSLISFALIMITVVLFLRSGHSQKPQTLEDAKGQYDNVDIRPSAAFASIGGIFTILSLAVNVGCCFSKKIRQITPLSNAIFATVSVVGIASWLSGCFYLHRNSAGRNLWYYVCNAAQQYNNYAEAHESSSSTRMLFRRDSPVDSKGLNVIAMCNYTQNAWDLGILQACFEIVTLLNVVVAVVIVRWSWFRLITKSR